MTEFAETILSFTPVTGSFKEVLGRLGDYLNNDHKPPCSLPTKGTLLTVDENHHITMPKPLYNILQPLEIEQEAHTSWRAVSVEAAFHNISTLIRVSIRQVDENSTHLEVRFPTAVYEGIFNSDKAKGDFDRKAKSSLIQLFINLAVKLGADGFGWRLADEGQLFGATSIDYVRNYVQLININNRLQENSPRFILAGLHTSCVKEEDFDFEVGEDFPHYYRQKCFYIYDRFWPE